MSANNEIPRISKANCHCGTVAFEATMEPDAEMKWIPGTGERKVLDCNCSICTKNGYLLVYPLITDVTWLRGYNNLGQYSFGKKENVHLFCKTCGTSMGIDMTDKFKSWGKPPRYGMNLRVFENVDLEKFPYEKIDGWNKLEPAYGSEAKEGATAA